MRVLLAIALAACWTACSNHATGPAGPEWPRPAVREIDGGESLAPRAAARAIAAVVEEDRPADHVAADRPAPALPAAPPAAERPQATAAAAALPADDPATTEEIVIEIDD